MCFEVLDTEGNSGKQILGSYASSSNLVHLVQETFIYSVELADLDVTM